MKKISSISFLFAISSCISSIGLTQYRSGEEDIEAAWLSEMGNKGPRAPSVEGEQAQPALDRREIDEEGEEILPRAEPSEMEANGGEAEDNGEWNARGRQHSFARLNNRASTDDDFSRRVRPRRLDDLEVADPVALTLPLENPIAVPDHAFQFGGREFASHFGFGSGQP